MMRNTISTVILLLILSSCKSDPLRRLPSIDILLKDSLTKVNTLSIHAGKPIMLINFEADCKHCQDETDSLLKYVKDFPGTIFCFINMVSMHEVRTFSEHFKLDTYKNIIIGQDTGKVFVRHVGMRTTPMSVVYDANGNMIVTFVGEAKMTDLIPILSKLN